MEAISQIIDICFAEGTDRGNKVIKAVKYNNPILNAWLAQYEDISLWIVLDCGNIQLASLILAKGKVKPTFDMLIEYSDNRDICILLCRYVSMSHLC